MFQEKIKTDKKGRNERLLIKRQANVQIFEKFPLHQANKHANTTFKMKMSKNKK